MAANLTFISNRNRGPNEARLIMCHVRGSSVSRKRKKAIHCFQNR